MQFFGYAPPPWLHQILACMGGCIGYSIIPPENTLTGEISRVQTVRGDNRSEDLSSSCTIGMDQSAAQSQTNVSSTGTGTPNQPSVPQTSPDPQSDNPVFVNNGLILWNQIREQWLQMRGPESRPRVTDELVISEDETYESLLGSHEPFPQPIPLGEMVDFLVDVWDMEGLYD